MVVTCNPFPELILIDVEYVSKAKNSIEDFCAFKVKRKEITAEEWLEQCRETYQRELQSINKKYPGQFVAIDGNDIIEINKLKILEEKYLKEGLPSIKIYYIPIPQKDMNKAKLNLSTPLFG